MRNSSSLIENDTFPFKQVFFINDVHCVLSIAHELEEPFFSGCYEVFVVCMHLLQRNVLGCRKTSACAFKGEQTESGITGLH